jgi:nicotinate-nucleotide pyrophosphorylase (carboxylating)
MGLYDMIMLKDNHIDFAGGIEPAITKAREYIKSKKKNIKIEIIMKEEKLQDVAEEISRTLFANFAIVLYVSDVGVLRPEKF